jgi:hypothetical protein
MRDIVRGGNLRVAQSAALGQSVPNLRCQLSRQLFPKSDINLSRAPSLLVGEVATFASARPEKVCPGGARRTIRGKLRGDSVGHAPG